MENERDEAKEEARIARLAAVAMGDVKAWQRMTSETPWRLRRKPSAKSRLRLLVEVERDIPSTGA